MATAADISAFHRDAERSYTLPAHNHYDTEIYEREKGAIFYRTWQYAGPVERVASPGGLRSRSYQQGRLIVDAQRSDASEHAVHHFQSLVAQALS